MKEDPYNEVLRQLDDLYVAKFSDPVPHLRAIAIGVELRHMIEEYSFSYASGVAHLSELDVYLIDKDNPVARLWQPLKTKLFVARDQAIETYVSQLTQPERDKPAKRGNPSLIRIAIDRLAKADQAAEDARRLGEAFESVEPFDVQQHILDEQSELATRPIEEQNAAMRMILEHQSCVVTSSLMQRRVTRLRDQLGSLHCEVDQFLDDHHELWMRAVTLEGARVLELPTPELQSPFENRPNMN